MHCAAETAKAMQDQKTPFRPQPSGRAVRWLLSALILAGLQACALDAATSGRVVVRDRAAAGDVRIDSRDRALIEEYYRNASKSQPGAAGPTQRRPTLASAKGERLPPGAGRALPGELEARLSPLPRPYVRLVVGGDVVLANRETRVISDVLPAVIRQ